MMSVLCTHWPSSMKIWNVQIRNIHKSLQARNKSTTVLRQMTGAQKGSSDRPYVLLIIPIAAFGLGTWQVYRRQWKLNLIEELERKTKALPVALPEDLSELMSMEYQKVSVQGHWDHSREVYVTPRPLLKPDEVRGGGLIGGGGQTGAHVITPFYIRDRDMWILVNRGWVPRDKMNPNTRQQGQVEGDVTVTGVIRKPERRPPFGIDKAPANNQWLFRDHYGMAEALQTEPICLDADQSSTVPGGPVGGQTRVQLRNEHWSYIFTWYSLSAATAFMWYSRYVKKLP